jgi:hypothetical protein
MRTVSCDFISAAAGSSAVQGCLGNKTYHDRSPPSKRVMIIGNIVGFWYGWTARSWARKRPSSSPCAMPWNRCAEGPALRNFFVGAARQLQRNPTWYAQFVPDSLLEQAGFELTVPLATDPCGAANPGRSFSSIWTLMMI